MPEMPISYREFFRNPVIGILFLSLFAITYLYIDNKSSYKDIITKQEDRIIKLESTVERLQREVNKRDSMILSINTKINNLNHE